MRQKIQSNVNDLDGPCSVGRFPRVVRWVVLPFILIIETIPRRNKGVGMPGYLSPTDGIKKSIYH